MPRAEAFLDFAAFMKTFREIGPVLDLASLPIILATGEAVAAAARQLAPEDTGELASNIAVQGSGIDQRGAYVDVGTREPYAIYQEFGTVHNPPHPFLRPALAAITGQEIIPTNIILAPLRRRK